MIFLFDLDGTLTVSETLPTIARHFSVGKDVETMTNEAVSGAVPFAESFARRVGMLGHLSVERVSELLAGVRLFDGPVAFIRRNTDKCFVVSSNLDCWCRSLAGRIGCEGFYSEAKVENDSVADITSILCKEDVVAGFRQSGEKVVFIGDGDNDFEAMREADIAIVCAMTHTPTPRLRSVADYVVDSETELCDILERLLVSK